MTSKAIITSALLLLLSAVTSAEAEKQHHHLLVPAVYVFGDSLVDVGNNNYLPGGADSKANYPHYGIDYPGHKPTGRFSNGYIAVDFLAQKLGFQESPPAVLSVRSSAQETGGLNFASGGAGILDTTRPNVTLSLNTQIEHFRRVVRSLTATQGVKTARRRLARSLFVVSTGSNDLFVFYAAFGSQNSSQADGFISSIATQLGGQLRELYSLGARRFLVFAAPQIGCAPAMRELDPKGGCADHLNRLSVEYNTALKRELGAMASSPECKDMRYSYADTYAMIASILKEPRKYGFKEVVKACCGSGRFNGATPCLPNATYCAHRDEYAVWDWSHPTQAAYKIFADWIYDGPRIFVQPVNIHALIK